MKISDYVDCSYAKQTELAKAVQARKDQIVAISKVMTVQDHVKLIEQVIRGHAGALVINVIYSVPGANHSAIAAIYKELGWVTYASLEHLTISNSAKVGFPVSQYDEHSYRRYETKHNGDTVINFAVPSLDVVDAEKLMLFKDHIRVRLDDLLVKPDEICQAD